MPEPKPEEHSVEDQQQQQVRPWLCGYVLT